MRIASVIVSALLVVHPAFADVPITLDQAQAEARAHAPERVVADASVAAAEVRAEVAGRRLTHDPVVVGRYQQPAPGQAADDRSYSAGLEWTLDLSGAWNPRASAARATVQASRQGRMADLLELDTAVANAFAELADAQRRIDRATRLLALRDSALHAAQRLRSTGAGNQLDLDAAALDASAARVDVANARGDLEVARTRLARLLGRPDGSAIVVSDEIDPAPVPPITAIDDLVARDPRVQAAMAELDAARETLQAEQLAARPAITLGLEVGHARHDIPRGAFASMPSLVGAWSEWELSVQLSLPLPLIERNRVGRAAARAELLAAEARLARVRADVRASVAEVRARLAAAADAARAAADVPPILERELQLLDKALGAGGLDLATWAQQAHRIAEVGRTYDEALLALRRARAAWARFATP